MAAVGKSMFSASVLTVSDTAAIDEAKDRSGPLILEMLREANFRIAKHRVVADEPSDIQDWLKEQIDENVNLIVCSGGTGFGDRDYTPEAVSKFIVRHAPGLVQLMLASSIAATPLGALSRPVAGLTSEGSLIVTLPGSPKAVREILHAILPVLSHALDLAAGGTGAAVHQQLAREHPGHHPTTHTHAHSHHHEHGSNHKAPVPRTIMSNDISQGVSSRQRKSPYPIIELEEAYRLVLQHTPHLPVINKRVDHTLRGHVLAEDVIAKEDWPRTKTTNVDGYALRASTIPGIYPVVTSARLSGRELPTNTICRVNTGGPLPDGADAVIMVEDTLVAKSNSEGEEMEIELLAQVEPGENIRQPGSDIKCGDRVLAKGDVISDVGGEIGTLACVRRTEVRVHRRPIVAIMSTGNEISDLLDGKPNAVTPDSNRPSLHLALTSLGYGVLDLGIATDDIHATKAALQRGAAESDLIIATGGTSMGEADLLKPVLERELGGTVHFGRVAMKPGKPTTFATLPTNGGLPKPVFALPGNPSSALVTFNLFVRLALRKMEGRTPDAACHLPRVRALTLDDLRMDPRPEFHRVSLKIREDGQFVAKSTGGQRSSRTVSLAYANGLVALRSGTSTINEGSYVDVVVIGEIAMEIQR